MTLKPSDLLHSTIGALHRRLQDQFRGAPDVGSDAIILDEGNDRIVRDVEFTGLVYPDPGTLSGIRSPLRRDLSSLLRVELFHMVQQATRGKNLLLPVAEGVFSLNRNSFCFVQY